MTTPSPSARIVAVQEDIVTIEVPEGEGHPLVKNEVVFILPQRLADGPEHSRRQERLEAEVLRVAGRRAVAQVFESTRAVAIGDPVEQTGRLLSVTLGPGLLGQVYDGLQNPLEGLASRFGTFLPRGVDLPALDPNAKWSFVPAVRTGARLRAGDTLGTVQEGRYRHKIMVPFDQVDEAEVTWIQQGNFTVDTPIARIADPHGNGVELELTMAQEWPVRRPLPTRLLRQGYSERLFPDQPLLTRQRLIDTFFPIARGGTACIPGPFGAGKTVLQTLISRFSAVDVVIVVACGERAGEVVETITEFPKLDDPKTGGSLMDRTIIICNTSSMPVAAREASIYTGLTLGEYYRQMGYDVLLLADSTSRWAQAMRETSGRMEEIPGEEAFPAYLDSAVRAVYERAGLIRCNDDTLGSLTLIGTVSPAGGNFDEPVTQATLGTVKCFLGLSAERAYKRFYPAVDPLLSWSRYHQQLAPWFAKSLSPDWAAQVQEIQALLQRGDAIAQMMQVTGEEGVTLGDFVTYQQALFVDAVYLQQDAYDPVDAATPLARQAELFGMVFEQVQRDDHFDDKAQVRDYYTRLTALFRNLNYAEHDGPPYRDLLAEIEALSTGAARQSTSIATDGAE